MWYLSGIFFLSIQVFWSWATEEHIWDPHGWGYLVIEWFLESSASLYLKGTLDKGLESSFAWQVSLIWDGGWWDPALPLPTLLTILGGDGGFCYKLHLEKLSVVSPEMVLWPSSEVQHFFRFWKKEKGELERAIQPLRVNLFDSK